MKHKTKTRSIRYSKSLDKLMEQEAKKSGFTMKRNNKNIPNVNGWIIHVLTSVISTGLL